jgi:hypothetical protein
MDLEWISPAHAAGKWRVTTRQKQYLCSWNKNESLAGLSHFWLIPKDAPKPPVGRFKAVKH